LSLKKTLVDWGAIQIEKREGEDLLISKYGKGEKVVNTPITVLKKVTHDTKKMEELFFNRRKKMPRRRKLKVHLTRQETVKSNPKDNRLCWKRGEASDLKGKKAKVVNLEGESDFPGRRKTQVNLWGGNG